MAQEASRAPRPSPATSRPAPAPAPPLPPPPPTPAARRPDTPRKVAQVTGRISGNVTHCQEASKHTQNEVHHVPDSSKKQRMLKSSGGTYSKPDARVKLIPAEEITYVQHRKPYCRTVGLAGLKKRHCRRSITPPPSSRKVSIVPMPSAPSYKLTLYPKRLETAENGDSVVREDITRSVTHQISSLKNSAPPSCKSSQPSSTSLNTDAFARDFDRMDIAEVFSRYYGSHISHSQGQSSEWPDSLPKEASIYSASPNPKQVLAPWSSEDHLGTKAGPSSKSVCTPASEELLSPTSVFRQQPTVVCPDRIRTAAPILRKHILPSPISLPSVRSTEVYPNSKSGPKEAAINPVSPSSKQVFSLRSSHHLSAKAGAPSKSVCTPENGKSCSTSCNIATRSTATHVLPSSVVESALLNPTPVHGERSRKLCPDGPRTADAPIQKKPIVKHALPSPTPLLSEGSTYVYPNSKAGVKGAVINHLSSNPKQVLCSSEDHLGPKVGTPSNSVCAAENELCTRSCNLATRTIAGPALQSPVFESALLRPTTVLGGTSTEVHPDRISTAVPTHQDPVTEHVLPSPTTLLSERSTEVHPNSSTGLCSSNNLLNRKCDMVLLHHKSIPRTHSLQSRAPTQCSTSINCDTSTEFLHKGVQETGAPVILHTKLHKKHYQSEAPWKGNFHVTGELKHICDGLEAHFPFQIFVRVYEASKQMPEILKLEAVSLSQLWPKKFKMKSPDGQDIGLCFISSHQRPHRSFDHLLEKISSHIGLWTNIGDTELSIFSSKLLSADYQRKDGKFYFWGIFGKHLRKNQRRRSYHISSMKNSNLNQPNGDPDDKSGDTFTKLDATEVKETGSVQTENDMTVDPRGKENVIVSDKNGGLANVLDVTGGNKTDTVNECAEVLGTPNSYPASSCAAPAASLNGCCNHDTANKSTFNVADLMVDYPPGFSLKTDRVNECAAMLGTLDSNPASNCTATAASLHTGCCNHDTFYKSTFSEADLMLDKPPVLGTPDSNAAVVLGTPDSNAASNDTATASLLDGCYSHGSANKGTSSLADSPCKPANVSSAGSALISDSPNELCLKTDGINGCDVVLGTPNSNPPSSCAVLVDSLLSRCFGRDWNKSTLCLSESLFQPANTSLVGPDLVLDTHLGCSPNVPPGFTKAHCRTEAMLNTQPGVSLSVPPGFTKAHCQTEANDEFHVEAPLSVVMDTLSGFPNNIPPGFTEAHRRLPTISSTEPETGVSMPVTEKKPLIRFSLNVPRLVRTESLPGFTTLNTVKKEPESPAVDKATVKLTPSPLAYGASLVRKAGQADGARITLDEVTVEDGENSEREFPKIRRLSELYGASQSCTDVCRSVSSNLADRFQATEQPGKQRHQGKRGMQEPSESSLADIAKRLKVNGRLALKCGSSNKPRSIKW